MKRGSVSFIGAVISAAVILCSPLQAHVQDNDEMTEADLSNRIDPTIIAFPNLDFIPDPEIESNYDKYYYFHRVDTNFDTAYMDILECDGYARGLTHRLPYQSVPYQYVGTIGGVVGGAIGNALADAIYGSAERRRQRRYNMRTCMGFKGYRIYGLSKPLWEAFNFEEGNRQIDEGERLRLLQVQARVASGPTPRQREIVE